MNLSVSTLRRLITKSETTRTWPNNAERLFARVEGDWDWSGKSRSDFFDHLDRAANIAPLASLLPDREDPIWSVELPHHYGHQLLFVAILLTEVRPDEPPTFDGAILSPSLPEVVEGSLVVDGDLEVSGRIVICGDLTVSGDCQFGRETVVCGNLEVGGRWLGSDEYGHHAICGDATFGDAFLVQGETFVAGHVKAPGIFVHNPDYVGFLRVLNGVTATVFSESAVDGFARCQVDGALKIEVSHPAWIAGRDETDVEIVERLRRVVESPPAPELLRSFFDDWMSRLFGGERLRIRPTTSNG